MAYFEPDVLTKYHEYLDKGRFFQGLMESRPRGPGEPGPVRPFELIMQSIPEWQRRTWPCHLNEDPDVPSPSVGKIIVPRLIQEESMRIGIGPLTNSTFLKVAASESEPGSDPRCALTNIWEGIVAEGALFIEWMYRTSGPYASEVTLIQYRLLFPLDTLQYIFIMNVPNEDTRQFVLTQLYVPSNGLSWPDPEFRAWGRRLGGSSHESLWAHLGEDREEFHKF